jgi:beta-fructofuranosidase
MFTKPGHHIGDTWYFVQSDCVHMFYLTCPLAVPRHTRWSIGHAVSHNLVDWQDVGIVLQPGAPGSWDGICLATGSVTAFDGRYYMAYTGNFAAVGLAVSTDLHEWEKLPNNPVTAIDRVHYSDKPNLAWKQPRWRDPFLFQEQGKVYQLVTAAKLSGPEETAGTVAVACSFDMKRWEILPPLDVPGLAQDLECPKLARIGKRYYLTVSISDAIAGCQLRDRQPEGLPIATAYTLVSDSFGGPYTLCGAGRILEDNSWGSPYACEPVPFRGEYFLLGTVWSNEKLDSVCDPIPIVATEEGFRAQQGHRGDA